jgi:hypothetical protein
MNNAKVTVGLRVFVILYLAGCSAGLSAAPVPSASEGRPRIQFNATAYDFGRVKAGDPVEHTYTFTNIGTGLLRITEVNPQCGCTTAKPWSREVQPGQTGQIPVQFKSDGFFGSVRKTVSIRCNDTSQPTTVLEIKGTVWKPVDVEPQMAYLNVLAERQGNAKSLVRIVNNMPEPLVLSRPESNGKQFTAELRTITPGKEFELTVRPVPPLEPGTVHGTITIKTSSTNAPSIDVLAFAHVHPLILVSPPEVALPAGALVSSQTISVLVQNNGTNDLKVFDPAVNVAGATVQLNESAPGRVFGVTLNLPAGFDVTKSQNAAITLKSSHPKQPLVKVPIVELATRPPVPAIVPLSPPPRPAAPGRQ